MKICLTHTVTWFFNLHHAADVNTNVSCIKHKMSVATTGNFKFNWGKFYTVFNYYVTTPWNWKDWDEANAFLSCVNSSQGQSSWLYIYSSRYTQLKMWGTICLGSQSKNFCSSDVAWIGSIWRLLVLRGAICISAEVTNSTNKLKLFKKFLFSFLFFQSLGLNKTPFTTSMQSLGPPKKCFLSIKFNILPTCVVPPFERFNAFLIWAGSSNGVHELCFDTLCRGGFFFSPPFPSSWRLRWWDGVIAFMCRVHTRQG